MLEFIDYIVKVSLEHSPREYIIGIGIFIGSFILGYAISIILNHIKKFTQKTKNTIDDQIIDDVSTPIKLLFTLLGFFIAAIYLYPELQIGPVNIEQIAISFIILILGFGFARVSGTFLTWSSKRLAKEGKTVDMTLVPFIRRFVAILIYAIAFIMIFDNLGIKIGPLLAGLGIAGLAIALALQDTLSNLFAAIYLATDRPIRIGDYIELEGGTLRGFVEDISWRTTRIRTLQNNYINIPNSKLAQSTLINYNAPTVDMSFVIPVGVSYSSDLEKVEKVTIQVAKEVHKKVEGAVKDFEPFIRYSEFADSSINLSVIMRANTFTDQYAMKHDFIKRLHKAYKKNRIEIPFPQRDLHMKRK